MAKYSKGAQKGVESAMKRMEKGTLRSGKSNKKVTNPKQAIAIGLSEAKKKGAKVPAKKTATKKAAAKKTAPKKKKAAATKTAVAKKKAVSTRKPIAKAVKKAAPKKAPRKKAPIPSKAKKETKKITAETETTESNLPPVEEKSPEVNTNITNGISGMTRKDLQRAAARNYDNHHIRLSNVSKGGIKPSGKKPLW